jgi:lipopolysaccharide/colanic/teichoic acid biosynthesis glycosyltransferase
MLCLERRRVERSGRRFVLMLLEWESLVRFRHDSKAREKVLQTLLHTTRETDVKGWYKEPSMFGIIFTEVGPEDGAMIAKSLLNRVTSAFAATLSIEEIHQIRISFHVFPHEVIDLPDGGPPDLTLYPEEKQLARKKRWNLFFKRVLDIAGSAAAMIFLLPVFAAIAAAVKLTSPGPVLFRQERVGRYGRKFTFLKFRSMHVANDESIHREFTRQFISGEMSTLPGEAGACSFKIKNDPRVTPIGKWLRRTSLDELPQFWNVLTGDMSIVGPRPPVPYEFTQYSTWHRRRLMSVKPGITGLWQVCGRSRVKFDEMVRLDLLYAENWDVLLDLQIMAMTPQAVVGGSGAF